MFISSKYSDPDLIGRLRTAGFAARWVAQGNLVGHNKSPYVGHSAEFADFRPYSPGDDLRRLDWRVFARTGRYLLRRYEEESNLRAALVLDTSASMRYAGNGKSKFDHAATAITGLATLFAEQRDASALIMIDVVRKAFLPFSATEAQLRRVVDLLEKSKPERETGIGKVLQRVAEEIPRRSVVIIASDFLDEDADLRLAFQRLSKRFDEILLLHVLDRDELELPQDGLIKFRDLEVGGELLVEPRQIRRAYQKAMQQFCENTRKLASEVSAHYVLLRSDVPLSTSLVEYLHRRSVSKGRGASAKSIS
ncbi:MAG: DUF58 domain-containing protein [Planctomycetes bacterium]|nr:DUF58 domain-containing protein [Planctomycetota bacterium]